MKLKILVVDDEKAMQDLLKDFLTSQGYTVVCLSDGEAALEYLKTIGGVSAIVADVCMGPLNGIQLARTVKRDFPSVAIFLFTGQAGLDEKHAGKATSDGYLLKPFSLGELKALLDNALVTSNRRVK